MRLSQDLLFIFGMLQENTWENVGSAGLVVCLSALWTSEGLGFLPLGADHPSFQVQTRPCVCHLDFSAVDGRCQMLMFCWIA